MEYIYGFKSCAQRATEFRDKFFKMNLKEVENPSQVSTYFYFHVKHIHNYIPGADVNKYYEADTISHDEWRKTYNCRGTPIEVYVDDRNPAVRTNIELFHNPNRGWPQDPYGFI